MKRIAPIKTSCLGPEGSLRRQLTGHAIGTLALNITSRGFMLVTSILLAQWLGADGYGVYASAMAVLLLLGVPTILGLPTLVIRLLASYRVEQKWELISGLLFRTNQIVFTISIILGLGGATAIWIVGDYIPPMHAHTLFWAMALLPITALAALRSAALRGLHNVVLGQLPESLIMPSLFTGLLLLWNFTLPNSNTTITPDIALGLRFASSAIAFAVGAWLLLRKLPQQVRDATPEYDTHGWLRASFPLIYISAMIMIITQIDVLMLAIIQGTESAGVYQATARGAELVAFSLIVANMTIQPTISRLYTSGEGRQLQLLITTAARITLAIALPAALILSIFATPILGTVFGPDFSRGAHALMILCAAQVLNAATGSAGEILNMTGKVKDMAMGMTVGAISNIILNLILIPKWDIEGAAAASGLSLIAWNTVLVLRIRHSLGIDSTVLGFPGKNHQRNST